MLVSLFGPAAWAQYDFDPKLNPWYPHFPKPACIYRTPAPSLIGGFQGADFYMLQSLAGLAAKSVREGTGKVMVWIDCAGQNEYSANLLTNLLAHVPTIQDGGVCQAWNLVDLFKASGVVKGYIVYDFDASKREVYGAGTFDESVNVATSLSSVLGGIIIRSTQIATAQAHGLTQLADVRGQTEQWAWTNYGSQFTTTTCMAQDPKMAVTRDYAIAMKAFCLFGVDSLLDSVLAYTAANTPVLGWNQGDEFIQTEKMTRWGHWNAANNLTSNLAVLSIVKPGADVRVAELDLNAKSRFEPFDMVWENDVHYTSLVLSDGDSFNLNVYYLNDPEKMYYQHRSRGAFSFGWGTAAGCEYQTAPGLLELLADQATANDCHLLFAGGYYYPDLYGTLRAGTTLADHLKQIAPMTSALKMSVGLFTFSSWNSAASNSARAMIARHLPSATGFLAINYSPYTEGLGQIFWNDNGTGVELPTFMARYTAWNNTTQPGGGTPLEVAAMINAATHTGAATSSNYFDWCIVHAWSLFQNGNDIPQTGVSSQIAAGIESAFGAAKWIADNVQAHVRLVTPEQLAWYTRLHLRTRQTFDVLLARLESDLTSSTQSAAEKTHYQSRLTALRNAVVTLNYSDETAKQTTYESMRALRQQILATPSKVTILSLNHTPTDRLHYPQVNVAAAGGRLMKAGANLGRVDQVDARGILNDLIPSLDRSISLPVFPRCTCRGLLSSCGRIAPCVV